MRPRAVHIHLVSDATGETIHSVARACLAQFAGVERIDHAWPMARSEAEIDRVVAGVAKDPGPVLFTVVEDRLRVRLMEGCRHLEAPCISVLDPVIAALGLYLGAEKLARPGRQHALDAQYFDRIESMHYVLAHDDGQGARDLNAADVVVVGVSRTSKTPTCVYLANRGIKAANVPLIADMAPPDDLAACRGPLIVGLVSDPRRLVQIRRSRLRTMRESDETEYVDLDRVRREVAFSRRLCARNGWPVIDVTRRSIEETAAAIMQMMRRHVRPQDPVESG